ncbi:MAG TPA: hypothetical protein VFA04_18200, partial [Bryobacteraceae bacterium]|nr:hypothetical protein [Bryobacteraceae bacterium]
MSDGPTNDPGSERNADVASALAQLTSGWKPAPNVAPEALTAARAALAGSLVAGKPLRDLHGINLPLRAGPALNPQLESDLLSVVSQVTSESAPRTIAVVRSALAASLENPTGRPEWTRGARITQSYGPFQDLQGAPHWVDLFPLTRSIQFAFDNSGNTFGVFPVHTLVLLVNPSHLSLGAGSVWFLANLLSSALPGFTGFTITGGSLSSSAPLSLQNGVYVLPAGATLTAKVTLAPAPPPSGSGGTGQDAAAAVFTPPSDVNIHFRDGGTAFDVIADSSATAYGSTIALHWNKSAPFQLGGLPLMVVPCDAAPASFGFATVASTVFTPTGSAPITAAGWALPLSATTISTLPEAAGPGAAAIEFGAGVSLTTTIEPTAVPLTSGFLEIATGSLLLTVSGKAKPVTTTYQLWPLPAPSQLNATLQFATLKQFIITFSSTPAEELLISTGQATAHLDRPVDATGNRFGFQAP